MRLLRFAILRLSGGADDWHDFTAEHAGVIVTTLHHWTPVGGGVSLALGPDAPLEALPATDESDMVLVFEAARRLAEEALELTADLTAVATGQARSLSSPRFVVAFRAENDRERRWLQARRDVATAQIGVAAGRLTVAFDARDLVHVFDREDGVALWQKPSHRVI